ncbi:MAG TPA: VOC family protein [Anaerolineae bacterium]|nr:VOC family protein [Anaerolineae bacterium]HIP73998.1 VOC family protein [Anaerolineae bacterium]
MSAIHWFELPVDDISRACTFYGSVLNAELKPMDLTETMGTHIAMIPHEEGTGGMLVQGREQGYVPSVEGSLLYLAVKGDMDGALGRVEAGGGQVILPKTSLGDADPGFIAWINDTEGNRVGLYSKE